MPLKKIKFSSLDELRKHILSGEATFYFSSQTSTVIPYDKIEAYIGEDNLTMGDLGSMPPHMEINSSGNLIVKGAVSWKDAREFLLSRGYNIMTSPTEDLALILAGLATSCTGERCFSFGNLRSQVVSLKYIDSKGDEQSLSADKPFEHPNEKTLNAYQNDYVKYKNFKNAPFPRFEQETDLLIGTEGQVGVIIEAELKIVKDESVQHLFMLIPKWEDDLSQHLDIINKIQAFRESVILCEFIDSNSFSYLPADERPNQEMDAIFFEVKATAFDDFYENFILKLDDLNEELIFELGSSKFHHLRASIPRAVFEKNSKMGVVKMGTDVQVETHNFEKLMKIYQGFTKVGVNYNLFGHFGDAHLHFNFMPTPDQTDKCREQLENMYHEVAKLGASPFAEHGIGLLKQKYIKEFWSKNQTELFHELKTIHDPKNQFFPQGFMGLK